MFRDRTLGNFETRIDTETQTRRALPAGNTSPRFPHCIYFLWITIVIIMSMAIVIMILTRMNRSAVETETPSPGCSEQEEEEQVSRHLPGGSSQFPTGETLHTELEEESGHGSVSRKATSPRQSSGQVSSPRQGSSPGQGPSPRRGAGGRMADHDKDCERPLGESTDHGDQRR